MPEIESDEVIVNVVLPEGAPYSRALEILAQLQDAEAAPWCDEVDASARKAPGSPDRKLVHPVAP